MKYYLSSYRIGEHGDKLVELSGGGPLAYIPNALDFISPADQVSAQGKNGRDLEAIGVRFEVLDLRDYFSGPDKLASDLPKFSGVWVTGGNTFVLRQAMRLSGFDKAISDLLPTSFVYGGYSAGICVLAPDLRALQIVDDPSKFPYAGHREVIWEGLNFLDFMILPHYRSDHPESADIEKEVEYCRARNLPYKTLSDGEVLYGEDINKINL